MKRILVFMNPWIYSNEPLVLMKAFKQATPLMHVWSTMLFFLMYFRARSFIKYLHHRWMIRMFLRFNLKRVYNFRTLNNL